MVERQQGRGPFPVFGLLFFCLLGGALLADPAPLAARSLHWQKVEVMAKIEADGSVLVRERQYMVMSGAFNGGERGFRLELRHRLELLGISRQVEQGQWKQLEEGNLEQVDHYDWGDNRVVRWRSRLPTDPEFDSTLLVYQLDYRITRVVFPTANGYALSHDFLFADREGEVEAFTLDLEIDPSWRARGNWKRHVQAGPLEPGQGYVVDLSLDWAGEGEGPFGPPGIAITAFKVLLLLALAGGMLYLLVRFLKGQAALGRFALLPVLPAGGEKEWLDQNLLSMRPEAVGALWDRKVGAPEVAALMARWVAEKKVSSRVEETKGFFGLGKSRVLHLKLEAGREEFVDYERSLLDKFFFGARRETDTQAIRKHYKNSGFDPAATIRPGLESYLEKHPEWRELEASIPGAKPTFLLFVAGFLALCVDFFFERGFAVISGLVLLLPLIGVYLVAGLRALAWRRQLANLRFGLLGVLLLPGAYLAWLGYLALGRSPPGELAIGWSLGPAAVLGYGLMLLAMFRSVLNIATSRETPEGIGIRQWLFAARDYLAQELDKREPSFSDAIFPFLLAFGLDKGVDRWFKAFGGAASSLGDGTHFTSGSASSGSAFSGSGGGFTGGGGLFGGGGATASWASAVGAVAAGVASSSSSSSSSGGGGGGSSSGGGSGGGW